MYDSTIDLIKTQQLSFINTFVPHQMTKDVLTKVVQINTDFVRANVQATVALGEAVSKLITK
jgi:hypothetical protein